MNRSRKGLLVLSIAAVVTLAAASQCYAEASTSEKSVTGFFRRLFNYPVKATQSTGEMTANTLNNTGEKVIAKTGENTANILTGQPDKADLGAPIAGTLETTGQTAAETVAVPVKAAEEEAAH